MKKEYKLHESYETENAIVRILVPTNLTEEDRIRVMTDLAQVSYDISLELYKQGKIRVATV